MRNEKSSKRIAAIAARGLADPESLTLKEIKAVCGSVVTQAPDRKAPAPKKARRG
jgi:hypothetical protein